MVSIWNFEKNASASVRFWSLDGASVMRISSGASHRENRGTSATERSATSVDRESGPPEPLRPRPTATRMSAKKIHANRSRRQNFA